MKKFCNAGCVSAVQDALYGKGVRIHTEPKKGEPRCTVCARRKEVLPTQASNHNPKVYR